MGLIERSWSLGAGDLPCFYSFFLSFPGANENIVIFLFLLFYRVSPTTSQTDSFLPGDALSCGIPSHQQKSSYNRLRTLSQKGVGHRDRF